jgi:PD-(D/E)XK nuclease superfamily
MQKDNPKHWHIKNSSTDMNDIQWYMDNKLTHQIHTSERKAFRACRRRWDWVHRDMYYPVVTPAPLEFGVAFHKAMEYFYAPLTWNSGLEVRRDLALVGFRRECEAQLKRYRKLNPDPDVTVIEDYQARIELGLNMIKYYCNEVAPGYDRGFTPIRVEVPFEVALEDPDTYKQIWCKCDQCWSRFIRHPSSQETLDAKYVMADGTIKTYLELGNVKVFPSRWPGLPVTYGGRLDMLAQDNLGRAWIFDWKTTIRMLDEDAEASFLTLDDQITSYCWALTKYGIYVAGFVYVEFKKAYPQAPRILEKKYRGRAVSTDKQFLTNEKLFMETIKLHDPDGWQMGLYDDHIAWLKADGPKFTQRHQIHRNAKEITNAGRNIALEAMDMINSPRIYPQPGRFSCNWCLFKQPCIGKNMGEDYEYTLRSMFEVKQHHYWEDLAPSTE